MIYAWLGQMLTDAIEIGNIARYLLLEAGAEAPVKVDTGETDFGPRLECVCQRPCPMNCPCPCHELKES